MRVELHINAVKESIDTLKDCIAKGIENRQRTIGFLCSTAAVDLLEIYLHNQNLIDPSANLKHNWFSSVKNSSQKLPDFPHKAELLGLLKKIESNRSLLCYGKPQPIKIIEETISLFNSLKSKLEKLGVKL